MSGEQLNNALRGMSATALRDRHILVTGASSGIGRAVAHAAAACGARLTLTGRSVDRLDDTLASLAGTGHVSAVAAIVDADDTFAAIKRLAARHGIFDGVVHCAGTYLAMPVKATRQKHIDAMFAASVWGAYGIARAVAHHTIMRDGGSVVFMSSVAARRGHPGTLAYAGAKAAILGMVPVLALELAPKAIRVNAVVCGTVETEMHLDTAAGLPPELIEDGRRRHMLGFGSTADIAAPILYLLSSASRWVTGTAMTVDGGYVAK